MQAISAGTSIGMKVPGVAKLWSAAGERFVQGSTGGPDAEARSKTGSQIVAIAYDAVRPRARARCASRASTATRSPAACSPGARSARPPAAEGHRRARPGGRLRARRSSWRGARRRGSRRRARRRSARPRGRERRLTLAGGPTHTRAGRGRGTAAAGWLSAAAALAPQCGVGVGAGGAPAARRPARRTGSSAGAPPPARSWTASRSASRSARSRSRASRAPRAPDYIRRRLRARETAGVILFGGTNGGDAAHWRRAHALAPRGRPRPHADRCVDQEGGDIRTVAHVGPAGGPALPGTAGIRAAQRARRRRGLSARGREREPRAGGGRAARRVVHRHARVSGRRARDRGAHDRGACAASARREWPPTAKHFPGLGGATVNTDDGPATVRTPIRRDLVPFRAAIEARVPLVMLSHASYPALDPSRIASQSRAIVTGCCAGGSASRA